MELIKGGEPLEFKYKDVTFYVKRHSVESDALEAWGAASMDPTGALVAPRAEYVKALVRCFVLGWKGVTRDGKEVPYSLGAFYNEFPRQEGGGEPSIFVQLASFILEKTDFQKEDTARKNDSGGPSGG